LGSSRHLLLLKSVYPRLGCGHLRTDDLLQQVFSVAASLGELPILAGDLNILAVHSAALHTSLATGKWHDIAASLATTAGEEPAPTCFSRTTQDQAGTRIDYMLANTAAFTAVQQLTVLQDTGLPTHLPVYLTLGL
jgi:endonuclease/exonuclease/phosphatase family metal-dependent hydrolase